jgi:solute carrier family 13 (sodium-dependent dicarboxylate transporter), member 2/3/5
MNQECAFAVRPVPKISDGEAFEEGICLNDFFSVGWSALEKKAALLMAVAILLWLTDFLHHISPAGTVCASAARGNSRYRRHETIELFARVLRRRREHGHCAGGDQGARSPHELHVRMDAAVHDEYLHYHHRLYWTAFVYHFLLAREISMLGTSPLVMEFAKSHDMHPLLLGMIWTFAAGGKLFAYQSGVLIVGYSYRYFAARDLVHMGSSETARVIRQKRSPVKSALFAPKVSGTIPARNETYP